MITSHKEYDLIIWTFLSLFPLNGFPCLVIVSALLLHFSKPTDVSLDKGITIL